MVGRESDEEAGQTSHVAGGIQRRINFFAASAVSVGKDWLRPDRTDATVGDDERGTDMRRAISSRAASRSVEAASRSFAMYSRTTAFTTSIDCVASMRRTVGGMLAGAVARISSRASFVRRSSCFAQAAIRAAVAFWVLTSDLDMVDSFVALRDFVGMGFEGPNRVSVFTWTSAWSASSGGAGGTFRKARAGLKASREAAGWARLRQGAGAIR